MRGRGSRALPISALMGTLTPCNAACSAARRPTGCGAAGRGRGPPRGRGTPRGRIDFSVRQGMATCISPAARPMEALNATRTSISAGAAAAASPRPPQYASRGRSRATGCQADCR